MIKIKIRTQNKKYINKVLKSNKYFKKGIKKALYDRGDRIIKYITKEMKKKNKTGHIYYINGKYHQASAPGQFPAKLTGDLIRSLDYKTDGKHQLDFGAYINYAKSLEFGTKKMKPRPFLTMTSNKHKILFKRDLLYYVNKEIKQI